LFDRGGDGSLRVVDLLDHFADRCDRGDGGGGVGLDRGYSAGDVFGRSGGFLGKVFDFGCYHGEALAGFSGAGGFDGGVEGEQVGLLGDAGDQLDDVVDIRGGGAQLANDPAGFGGVGQYGGRDVGRVGRGAGDLRDGCADLLGAGGDGGDVDADLLGGRRGCLRLAEDRSAESLTVAATAESSSDEDASVWTLSPISFMVAARRSSAVLSEALIRPISSRLCTSPR
jgi:hypothetical protein